jgi:hypothetical protein
VPNCIFSDTGPCALTFSGLSNRSRSSDSDYVLDSPKPSRRFAMADHGNSEPADLQVNLERTDPAHHVARLPAPRFEKHEGGGSVVEGEVVMPS